MNSYYFTIEIWRRGILQLIVEKSEFSSIANFYNKSAMDIAQKHNECIVKILKNYVSVQGMETELVWYKLKDMARARKLAMEC